MAKIRIRPAKPSDVAVLNAALGQLSRDIGDAHAATDADLLHAAFGPFPVFRAQIAELDEAVTGAILYSPVFSTRLGGPGAFVSDLWVAEAQRGAGLGQTLLAHAAEAARAEWGAVYLKLSVYDDNPRALQFYERLGFAPLEGETTLILGPNGVSGLSAAAQGVEGPAAKA